MTTESGLDLIDPYQMQTVRIEDVGDSRVYHYAQTTGYITNENERLRAEHVEDRKSEFRHRASVPLVVWNLWEGMGITSDQRELRKALMRHKHEYMVADVNL